MSSLSAIVRGTVLMLALLDIRPLMAQTASVRIRVTDLHDARVVTSRASIIENGGKPTRTVRANNEGEIILTGLPLGDHRFVVTAPGFKDQLLETTVRDTKEVKIEVRLEVCGGALERCEPENSK